MDTINWISFVDMDNELKLTTQIDEKKECMIWLGTKERY